MYGRGDVLESIDDPREDRRVYTFMLVSALFLLGLVAPYRGVHLPQVLLLSCAMVLALFCMKFAVEDFDKLLLLFAVYAPFQKVLAGDFGSLLEAFNVTNILVFFLLLGWLSRSFMRNEVIYERTAMDIPLILFMFLSSISVIRGELMSSRGDLFELKRWLMPMLVYLIVFNNLRSERSIRYLVVAICITTCLWGFQGLKEYYMDAGGLRGAVGDDARITGNTNQPNNFGAFFCYYTFLPMSFCLFQIFRLRAWFLAIPVLACTRAMLLTFSRGAQVSFFAGLTVMLLAWNRKVFFLLFVPMIVVFASNPDLIPGVFVGRMSSTIRPDGSLEPSADGRLLIWKASVGLIQDYPIWGVGFGNFQRYIGEPQYGANKNLDAHNIYILIAAEMGLPSFVAFMLVLGVIMYKALYVYHFAETPFQRIVSAGFLAGYSAMLVANMFGSRLKSNEIVFQFWILTAVIIKMAQMIKARRMRRAEETAAGWDKAYAYSTSSTR